MSILLMFGGGLVVLMAVLVSLVLAGVHQLLLAIRRVAVAGLVPSTFELPEIRLPWRPLDPAAAAPGGPAGAQPGQAAAGQGAPA